ncbi:dihydrofolate reductase family protein [Clostridium transplantifaecale]|uniref:dihydrofolate reductase family protein n=1 Tax=Clostridium transplantifaecale TaxID=2479838 RepID=UPI000F63D8A7|nr:dihydrofolate reductase family protein [Clostridium transplantifaecale]
MKSRAKVICHMMTTIDGKIVIDWDGNSDYELVGEEYDRLISAYGSAMGCGRATLQTDDDVDFEKYKGVSVTYTDKAAVLDQDTSLSVAFDRFGKLRPQSPHMEYGGMKQVVLEVLTEQVKPEFLAYLDDKKIPYLFAGKRDFEPELFLEKLKEDYHVDTFVLCGGAQINAEFMRHDLVDEISVVIGPAVDGNRNALTLVGADDVTGFPKFFKLKELRELPGNGVLLRYER